MIDLSPFAGMPTAVLGLGRSGLGAAAALTASGVPVLAWDDDADRRREIAAKVPLADLHACDWSAVRMLVLSPGIAHTHPAPHTLVTRAREAGCEIVSDIELLVRARPDAVFVGITGTNGKSTTTALIGHILARTGRPAAVGGNLGTPALALPNLAAGGIYVLELSSYQIELTPSLACEVAVLLNISPDHLDRYASMADYARAKAGIFGIERAAQTAVIGIDDPWCRAIHDRLCGGPGSAPIPIAIGDVAAGGIYVLDGMLHDDSRGKRDVVCDLRPSRTLPGAHNWQNAAAAYAAVCALGVAHNEYTAGVARFPGLAHRQETVAVIDGVKFVNDSKATNAAATANALACYDRIYWIAGGLAKEHGIQDLASFFPRIAHAFLIGDAAEQFARTLGHDVPHSRCPGLARAVDEAYRRASADNHEAPVVLLSPACASFDQFRDFEARGESFRCRVEAIAAQGTLGAAERCRGVAS